jgi:hypothetical protein
VRSFEDKVALELTRRVESEGADTVLSVSPEILLTHGWQEFVDATEVCCVGPGATELSSATRRVASEEGTEAWGGDGVKGVAEGELCGGSRRLHQSIRTGPYLTVEASGEVDTEPRVIRVRQRVDVAREEV